ncbi:hypothetical protein OSCI_3880040 [Kamptonema sp. PCC 6506]|nr:hypothetical protein OSCI_3880040 [Kamptonema sp. PCC 6506]
MAKLLRTGTEEAGNAKKYDGGYYDPEGYPNRPPNSTR